MIGHRLNNWIDRGYPPHSVLRRVLAYEFDRHAPSDEEWLDGQAATVLGMVAADATEVEVANYLRALSGEALNEAKLLENARLAGIALWHIAKASIVRDELVKSRDMPSQH